MAKQVINTGTTANDGTGDDARTWATKTNENFSELYAASTIVEIWEPEPSEITSSIWFDADDADAFTLDGVDIVQFRDKSGNGNHLNGSDASNRYEYDATNALSGGKGGVVCVAGNKFDNLLSMTRGEIYFVGTYGDGTETTFSDYATILRGANNSQGLIGNSGTGTSFGGVQSYVNGSSSQTNAMLPMNNKLFRTVLTQTTSVASILNYGPGAWGFVGVMNEIIVLPEAADSETRQKIEGYLAHKWGITLVDPQHPYRESAPAFPKDAGETSWSKREPFFTIPSVVHAVVGTELCLQYDAISTVPSNGLMGYGDYSVSILGSVGRNRGRFYAVTPTTAGDYTMTAVIHGTNGVIVTTREFTLRVLDDTGPATGKNILMIGDSTSSSGHLSEVMRDNFVAIGGTTPTLIGTLGDSPVFHEARGGWSFAKYVAEGEDAYRITVSGVTSVAEQAQYSIGAETYTVEEVHIDSGSGTLLLTGPSVEPASSGTATKVSGDGDATIAYSAVEVDTPNPFWNTSTDQLDIAEYRSANSIAAIDVVTIMLGINDTFPTSVRSDQDIDDIVANATDLIDAFVAENSSVKVVIALPLMCSNTAHGWSGNYGATYSRATYEQNIFKLKRALIAAFDDDEYSANVIVGSAGLSTDRYYAYRIQPGEQVAARLPDADEDRHVNALHPIDIGYEQAADAMFGDVLSLIQ